MPPATLRLTGLALLCVLPACEGSIVGPRVEAPRDVTRPADPNDPTMPRAEGRVALQPIRRLSISQYENTLRALFPGALGNELVTRAHYPAASTRTGLAGGFSSDSDTNTVGTSDEVNLEDNAEALAEYLLGNARTAIPALMPCSLPASFTDAQVDACIDTFITQFGRRAFRRPVRTAEQASIRRAYDTVRMTQGAAEAWATVMQYFLQAPALLYRAEAGAGSSGLVDLTPFELATRLSFFVTDAPPDAELSMLAESGALSDPMVLEAQARRLLAKPEAAAVTSRFVREWLRIDLLDAVPDNAAGFPAAMRDDYRAQADHLVRRSLASGSLRDLFRTSRFPLGVESDDAYGQANRGGANFPDVDVPERVGILSSAPFLTAHAPAGHQVPILRGAFLRKQVLCLSLPPLPGNIDLTTPLDGARAAPTARDRLAPTMTLSTCSGCHTSLNPLGYALENFDATGRHRTTENGATIDASGTLDLDDTTRWTFSGPREFLGHVASSQALTACAAKQFFHFAHGRQSAPEEQPFVDALADETAATGGTMSQLVTGIIRSPRFTRFLREAAP
ncbi:MAG: DUF1592 domain-containing protein [Myxococcaceae bacterium]